MIKPTTRVYLEQTLEGVSIPAIIHNGNFFFVDIDVYENGRVECWNFEDFENFKKNVNEGWVRVNIPDNKDISIHGLGSWTISNGNWSFSQKTFIDYVLSLIKELNPTMDNIYRYTQKKINGISVGEDGRGKIYKEHKRVQDDIFTEKINGQCVNLFYKIKKDYHLIKVNVFTDNTINLSRLENTVELNFEEFEKLVNNEIIVTEVPINSKVQIYGLGSFTIHKTSHITSIKEKLLEIKDIQRDLKGESSTIEICIEAYEIYMGNPTLANKEKLKISYENVPDHQKIYVGDMDTKDIEVRMIIYGEQEIENWSHYKVAKAMGEKLPTITIPKLNDEKNNS